MAPREWRKTALVAVALLGLAPACGGPARPSGAVIDWVAGHDAPAFDPDGPPDALRWAIERQMSRGLTDEDSSGRIVAAAAESISISPDGLTVRFHLRPHLAFADGHPCVSEDFRTALRGGLAHQDHGTRERLLGAVVGMSAVRAGRKLPPLGIETPDPRTLVMRLARPDSLLLRKLSIPGVSSPWRRRVPGSWQDACGLGPFRVARWETGRRLDLVRRVGPGHVDTLRIRFIPSPARVRSVLRGTPPDLVWPVPPSLLDQSLPQGFETRRSAARPVRHLLLVLRGDVPPTSKLPARRALAHALNRGEVTTALGRLADPPGALLPGALPFEAPKYDAGEVLAWLARGHLGRSFRVAMAYDAEGTGAAAARVLQGGWSRLNLYVELRPLRPADWPAEALRGQSQLVLVESQPLVESTAGRLADWVMPMRGPASGAYRSGWRTREFDAWIDGRPGAAALVPDVAQDRIEEEVSVLPLARLPWVRVIPAPMADANPIPVPFHPHFGPDFAGRMWPDGAPLEGRVAKDGR